MKDKTVNKKTAKVKFGEFTHPTLRGHYKPLSEFDQKVINLLLRTYDSYTEDPGVEINKSLNRFSLKPSYSEMAKMLNDQGQRTKRGNKWTPTGVRRLIEKTDTFDKSRIGHREKNWEASRLTRKETSDKFAIKIRDEVLPTIDLTMKHHLIAEELNDRGITTRTGGKWGNVAVKRLLERIERLKKE